MKLGKCKQALADLINSNGGWVDCEAIFAAMDGNGDLFGYSGKPQWTVSRGHWYGHTLTCWFFSPVVMKNHHQTILSREEYYQAYPMTDDDGWIEWCGGDCPVYGDDDVDVVLVDGSTEHGIADEFDWHHDSPSDIMAYRLHKPEVKPEFCESVIRSIPEPETKQTIEQLAQDYRNAREYAERLQKDADEAKDKSEEIKELLIKSGTEIGIVISIGKAGDEIEYKIGEKWFLASDLKSAGWTDEQLSDYASR